MPQWIQNSANWVLKGEERTQLGGNVGTSGRSALKDAQVVYSLSRNLKRSIAFIYSNEKFLGLTHIS